MDAAQAEAAALAEVIWNVRRLIEDASILRDNGRYGSAISLAILSFEEAGKGHIIELKLPKPKARVSRHQFRHAVSLLVLMASLQQKYGINSSQVRELVAKHYSKQVHPSEFPPEVRDEMRASLVGQFKALSDAEFKQLAIELRWLGKIGDLVRLGNLENLRQSGLYVDVSEDGAITSSPRNASKDDADKWIWAAGRILNILEYGEFTQSYSPLSHLVSRADAGDREAVETLELLMKISEGEEQNGKGV